MATNTWASEKARLQRLDLVMTADEVVVEGISTQRALPQSLIEDVNQYARNLRARETALRTTPQERAIAKELIREAQTTGGIGY
jgi:hypothetical protein